MHPGDCLDRIALNNLWYIINFNYYFAFQDQIAEELKQKKDRLLQGTGYYKEPKYSSMSIVSTIQFTLSVHYFTTIDHESILIIKYFCLVPSQLKHLKSLQTLNPRGKSLLQNSANFW